MSQMNVGPGSQPGGRPGQMTAVMRAMAQQTGPKVLRIGLVSSGRIVEERIIKQRTSVTIGPSERAMFVIQAPNVPPNFKLFELVGNEYFLNFLDGMSGRVALQTGVTDIAALKGQARRVGNAYQVRLTDDARGKVVIGETTFLFQFVAPPPVQPRPQLPLAVKGGVGSQIDWNLTTIAAFSLLFHFGLVFSFYTSSLFPWADPLYESDDMSTRLIDQLKNVPQVTPVQTAVAQDTAAPADTTPTNEPAKPTPQQQQGAAKPTSPGTTNPALASELNKAASDAKIALLAALGGGPASSDVLRNDNGASVNMNGLSNGSGGVSNQTNNGLNLNPGGGPLKPGGGNLSDIRPGGGGGGNTTAGPTEGPKIKGGVAGGGAQTSKPMADAEAVIRSQLHPRARACYEAGLRTNPDMAGKVTITIQVGPDGSVQSANIAQNSGLDARTAGCIASSARNLRFKPPGEGGSTVSAPMSFFKQ